MLTLLSTNEAASTLGISVQGVHYRIKTNKLKSIVKDGKTFVYVDIEEPKNTTQETNSNTNIEIIKVKDEQISLLKRAIRWMGFQHKQEIERIEKTHNKLIEVFKSEVELLQRAYNEMQTLYKSKNNIESKPPINTNYSNNTVNDNEYNSQLKTLELNDFILLIRKKGKSNNQIKQILHDAIKSGDSRFNYNPIKKAITISNVSFDDLL
ncbi:MAG: DNA-binding protein [Epsilonproteobacteria bacterium]|nr:DNA-binding protein [Campylobacterota bacterium]